jgi:hypothetical protein
MAFVTSGTSPAELMRRFRGRVTKAGLTYPERGRLQVTDAEGGLWRFATWEADYSPTDPEGLAGKTVVSADLDEPGGKLTIGFSDGTTFTVTPIPDEEDDAIENWELFTPEGLVLSYGPWGRWQLGKATDPC